MNEKGTILVVDDTAIDLQLLTHTLTAAGYQVRSAHSGELALASVAADPPELILLDIRMSDLDGFEVCRCLKAQEVSCDIPIIFISASTEVEERVKGFKLGAVDFISKPFQNEELLARVRTHLDLGRLRTRLEQRAVELRLANERLQTEITERRRTEEELLHEKERFMTLSEHAPFGIVLINPKGNFVYINPKFREISGYDLEDIPDGKTWFHKAFPDPAYRRSVISEWLEDLRAAKMGETRPRVCTVTCKDGTERIINLIPVEFGAGEHVMGCVDITEQKRLEEKLHALTIIDDLTGLYNRRGFLTLAQRQLKITERSRNNMFLFFADLDEMKMINDTLGHQEGDRALTETASVLKETFRESDIIGRIGGDEFAVLVIDASRETTEGVVKRLRKILEAHNRLEGRRYVLSLSIGIAQYDPEKPSSLDELMAQADTFMYVEKRDRKR